MIWVAAGTSEASLLLNKLLPLRVPLIITVVSPYGAEILTKAHQDALQKGDLQIHQGALARTEMESFVEKNKIKAILDLTHPYAQIASENLINLARSKNLSYLRYERPRTPLPASEQLIKVSSWSNCLQHLESAKKGEKIFLATGSRILEQAIPDLLTRQLIPYVRLLPESEPIKRCQELGLNPGQIIAIQGPFTYELNKALYEHSGAQWLITKESGAPGGTIEKIQAALELKMTVLVITRPTIEYPLMTNSFDELLLWVKKTI
ncbi:precorrin-6A reductase [Heliorestis acidaminivorans]|uniref:Precorrin-6A reductase n=1 Tax=Heliorestis acidaminivorans TaxID=553427 RepID=A0A6I0EUY9_9FIRM|nr:precorrin-6A reductase [Heliorestis acidaminivorans]KAB2954184.1 precorrin-6A reductase [Heliorestis acidaminivorans]